MTHSSTAHAPTTPDQSSRRALALTVILGAQLMLQMDFLIVMVALPIIHTDLGFPATTLSWVPNAFALALGGYLVKVRAFEPFIPYHLSSSV